MGATDLNVRVTNKTLKARKVLVYQMDPKLTVEEYLVGAWGVQSIGKDGGFWDFVLPSSIQVQARMDAQIGSTGTRILEADYNTAWRIFTENGALEIEQKSDNPGKNTIDIKNEVLTASRVAVVLKDARPLLAQVLPPGQKVNFSVSQKLYLALAGDHQKGALYEAVTLTDAYEVDFEGYKNLDVTIHEDINGLITFTHKFVSDHPSFAPENREEPAAAMSKSAPARQAQTA